MFEVDPVKAPYVVAAFQAQIEDIVVKHTHEMMIDDNVIEDIAGIVFRNAKKENPAIQLLKPRLSERENALNNLLRAIEEGIITSTTKQRLIDCFVNAVYLYDDKLVITFNYKEASKTVSLKEVNGSIIECSGAPKKK